MIADYIVSKIDNLFSNKLSKHSSNQITRTVNTHQPKSYFNKDIIKHHLPNVISRQGISRSPAQRQEMSHSPISKSRLKDVLQNNRHQNIKTVIRSPFKKFQIEGSSNLKTKLQTENIKVGLPHSKQNNIIKYYRQQRKSVEKNYAADRSQGKTKKSRIFRPSQLSHNSSNVDFR